jgi:hypothetical protein
LSALIPDRSWSTVVIEADAVAPTYAEAKMQALYNLALKLYDPYIESTETYTETLKKITENNIISEAEYSEYVHKVAIYQEGWVFSPEYEGEWVIVDGQKWVKATVWVGNYNIEGLIWQVYFLTSDMAQLHNTFSCYLDQAMKSEQARRAGPEILKSEKHLLLRFMTMFNMLRKLQVSEIDMLLEAYDIISKTYYQDLTAWNSSNYNN